MRDTFAEDAFTTQHGYSFERLIEPQTVSLGGIEYKVEAGAAAFARRR
jgi:hypothetical protein